MSDPCLSIDPRHVDICIHNLVRHYAVTQRGHTRPNSHGSRLLELSLDLSQIIPFILISQLLSTQEYSLAFSVVQLCPLASGQCLANESRQGLAMMLLLRQLRLIILKLILLTNEMLSCPTIGSHNRQI